MIKEPVSRKSPVRSVLSWLMGIILVLVLLFLLAVTSSRFLVIFGAPFHLLFGWWMHFEKTVPSLLGSWRMILLPIGCLMVAGFLLHRFVCWWVKVKGNGMTWRPAHTMTALGIFLLGCAAAIAMSGVVHQLVWLSKDPWTERHRSTDQTEAVNNARQLLFVLFEFQETEGRHPSSLQELEGKYQIPRRLWWVRTGDEKIPEPFVLLYPGGTESSEAIEPWIVSPIIGSGGKIVVGYSDGSALSLPAGSLEKILQSRDFKSGNEPAR